MIYSPHLTRLPLGLPCLLCLSQGAEELVLVALIGLLNFIFDNAICLCLLSRIEHEFDLSNRHAIVVLTW